VIARIALGLVALVLAGCVTLTPAEQERAAQVRTLADRTAQVYGLAPIHLLVTQNPNDPPGSFRRGYFAVSTITLTSTFRDAIVAHELGHYVLGHDRPLRGTTTDELEREYQQRELDANAKGVEILIRVAGLSEARALRTMYDYLAGVQWTLDRYPRMDLRGHKSPCEEMADLLTRFPQQKGWTTPLACAPAASG
jgi:IrrE N-terminal-like domain